MREEDNIEKEGLQEDNPDIGDNSGDEDFAEYDDLSALEGLPQIDELDNMDDLSGVSDPLSKRTKRFALLSVPLCIWRKFPISYK